MILPQAFIERTRQLLGEDIYPQFEEALATETPVSIRPNRTKCQLPVEGEPIPWATSGMYLKNRPTFTFDPLFHAGCYYVQEASSMFVERALQEYVKEPVVMLDLCAAPGGKTTDLAASLREVFGDNYILVSNEIMKQRVGILADNVALWGDPNVVVTSDDPRAFASLPGFFDVIVADVPCSGEGMFRKDEEAQKQWSEDNVALCEARQKRIVADVWPSLAQGGLFIYSTCTFNRLENDLNVQWIAEELGADFLTEENIVSDNKGVIKTEQGYSLVPGFVEGEGQYCAAVRKTSEAEYKDMPMRKQRPGKGVKETPMPKGLEKLLDREVSFRMKGETVTAVPAALTSSVATLEQSLHIVAAGCALGTVKGSLLIPDADLALSLMLNEEAFPSVEVDRMTALSYLHRDAITLPSDTEKGYVIIRHEGLPLGFVKNLGNRCNSLHPQSRRIRMDINR
jgi:16S rRNA C967 or C1407 C5-methylase (RsmB/RsmF family)/NOL1/NOP2/fmu family ribosome biogenesis protein